AALRRPELDRREYQGGLGEAPPLACLLRYPSRVGRMIRTFDGRFGRPLLSDLDSHDEVRAQEDPLIVLRQGDPELVCLNPGKSFRNPTPKRALVFHIAGEWLHESFPAAFDGVERKPF